MTKLISGRVGKVPSANVSADRYQFIELSETEPDLGLPSQLGQVFTSDLDGNRYWSRLDTANVIETANLYFTNTRAIAALTNVDISFNNVIVYGDLTLLGSADIEGNPTLSDISGINSIGAQEVLADEVTSNIWHNLYTSNVIELDNLYFTNTRAVAALTNVDISFNNVIVYGDLTLLGSADIEGNPTLSDISGINSIGAQEVLADEVTSNIWHNLYTANVIESSNNLYYTNDRVFSFVTGMSIGDLVDVANIYTYPISNALVGIQLGQALVWDGNIFIPTFVNSEVANVADLAVRVLSLEGQTTANVEEAASNLYFTNTRVLNAISLADISPNNVNANNIIVDSITANVWNRLYTANVIETAGNLYFTSQRARDSVSNSTGVYYNTTTGVFSIGQDVALTSDVQFRDLTLSGNLFILGNVAYIAANTLQINDPLIQIGIGNPGDQWDLGLVGHYLDGGQRHTGLFRDATDGKFKFFSNTTVEPGNVNYIDITEDSFRLASVVAESFEGNVIGTVSSIANHTTTNLAEGTNLYFTNARVIPPVLPLLTTANVLELDNLYFTNARVLSNVEQMSINVLADVDITGVSVNSALVWDGNKFIPGSTEAAIRSNFANTAGIANVALLANLANLVSSLSNHNTANLAEGTNLYYTNSRVLSALVYANVLVADLTAAGNLVANGLIIRGINVNDTVLTGNINITNIAAANVISANIISAQQWQGLYTANVIESPTNLYFTNTRARAAFTPGKGIAITAGGIIKNIGAPFEYNTGIDGSGYGNVLSTLSTLVTFPSAVADDRFLLRSIHITNVSDSDTLVSGNVAYASGNSAILANQLPIPAGGAIELLRYPQLFQPSDKVNLQGFTSAGTATSNLLQAIYTYETFTGDVTYKGEGQTLAVSNTDIMLFSSPEAFAIIESIKFVNLVGSVVPVKLFWADANNNIKAYLAHNLPVPPNSTIETITAPKRISAGDKIFARYTNAAENSISVFLSARTGFEYSLVDYAPNVAQAGTVSVAFSSSESDGTLLYYTIE